MMERAEPRLEAQEEAERWFARLMAPDCTPADRQAFEAWLRSSAENSQAYAETERMWGLMGEAVHDPEIESLPEAVVVERAASPPRRRLAWAAAAAAAAILIVVGYPHVERLLRPPPQHYATAVGETRTETLPDGSRVNLDALTRITVQFTGRERHVQVDDGTAFFEVLSNESRPFVAATRHGSATVLGTQFQVRESGDRMEVVLLEGSLRLDGQEAGAAPVTLRPGERAVVSDQRATWAISSADVEAETSWRQGRLIFRATPLPEALEKMNRYTDQKLSIGEPALEDLRISGIFHAGDVESFTLALQHSYDLRVRDVSSAERVLHSQPER